MENCEFCSKKLGKEEDEEISRLKRSPAKIESSFMFSRFENFLVAYVVKERFSTGF